MLQHAILRSQLKVGSLNEKRRHIQQGKGKFFSRHFLSQDRPQTELNVHQDHNIISIDNNFAAADPSSQLLLSKDQLQKEVAASGLHYRDYLQTNNSTTLDVSLQSINQQSYMPTNTLQRP